MLCSVIPLTCSLFFSGLTSMPRNPPTFTLSVLELQVRAATPSSYVDAGALGSVLHACTADTLPTEPYSQPSPEMILCHPAQAYAGNPCVLTRVAIAVVTKAAWGRKGLCGLHFHITVYH